MKKSLIFRASVRFYHPADDELIAWIKTKTSNSDTMNTLIRTALKRKMEKDRYSPLTEADSTISNPFLDKLINLF